MANHLYDRGKELFERGALLPQSVNHFIQDDGLVITATITVRRSWRERLFTLPWRPLQATRLETVTKPDPNIYMLPSGILVAHPTTLQFVSDGVVAEFKRMMMQ